MSRYLSTPRLHQLAIARRTLKLSDIGARILGGMTKEEAREIIKELTAPNPIEVLDSDTHNRRGTI